MFALPAAATAVAQAAPTIAASAAKASVMATLKTVAFNALTNMAISAAMAALQPQVGGAARTDEWVLSPDGPIPFAAGRIGVAGSVVYRKTFGPDLMYYGIPSLLSGAGPIDGYEAFLADDESVTFDGSGKAVSSQYAGELWYKNKLGTQPDTALVSPTGLKNGATLPGWTSAHKLSGKACYLIVMGENSKGSAFPTGEIKPLITLRGLKGWDPRLDSTYPGGSGPCRLNDPSTWVYLKRGPLWGLKWALGLWEGPTGKGAPQVDYQVGGIGAKLSGIDVASFVAAENIADLYDWTCSAYPNTDDDKGQVLDAFLQSAGCIYAQRAGKISCIQRAASRTSIVTISARDTAGPLEIDTAASRIDRINTLRPRFWSEPHRWQMTALDGEITATSYREEDGAVRSRGLDYPYVTDAVQCGQLAALQIANTREGIAGVIPLKPHLQRIRPGDAFTITEAGFVLNGLKCLCLNTDYDPATGVVRVSFVSETDGKYPFALGQNPTPPEPQVLTPVDPRFVSPPLPEDWVIVPRPPGTGGSLMPGFDLSGAVGNTTATAIEVQWWEVPAGIDPNDDPPEDANWQSAGTWPPTASTIPIDVQADRYYWLGLIHIRNQNYSERTVSGPWLAGKLIAGDVDPNAPGLSDIKADIEAAFGDIFDVSELISDARADIDAQGVEIAAARGSQPTLGARVAELAQATIDGDEANAEAISLVQARTANTEADIIDLENALATETGARAEAISQVTARQSINPNLLAGGSGERGVSGWDGSGGLLVGSYPTVAPSYFYKVFPVGAAVDDFHVSPKVWVEGLGTITAQWAGYAYGGATTQVWVAWYNASGVYVGETARFALASGSPQTFSRPSGATFASWVVRTAGAAPTGYADVVFHSIKIEKGSVATIYSTDATQTAISASVTEHALAIIDLENQQNIALWRIKAEASGSRPAIIEAYSGLGVSALAFSAEQLYLGDNTIFDDATNTWQTIDGSTVYIRAEGAPFGAFSNLREWWGPTGIALGAMTPDNGYSGRMTTAPYNFTNTLNPRTFSAYASPGSIEAHRSTAGSLTSAAVSILYQNAKGAVTVTWERLIGGVTAAGTAVIDAPTALTTTFTKTVSAQERTDTVFQATLTDAGSGERRQVIVPVVFTSGAA